MLQGIQLECFMINNLTKIYVNNLIKLNEALLKNTDNNNSYMDFYHNIFKSLTDERTQGLIILNGTLPISKNKEFYYDIIEKITIDNANKLSELNKTLSISGNEYFYNKIIDELVNIEVDAIRKFINILEIIIPYGPDKITLNEFIKLFINNFDEHTVHAIDNTITEWFNNNENIKKIKKNMRAIYENKCHNKIPNNFLLEIFKSIKDKKKFKIYIRMDHIGKCKNILIEYREDYINRKIDERSLAMQQGDRETMEIEFGKDFNSQSI